MKRTIAARVFCVIGGVVLLLGAISVPRLHAEDDTSCSGRGPLCSRVVTVQCSGNTCTIIELFQYRN
jgi:hypothetical protein